MRLKLVRVALRAGMTADAKWKALQKWLKDRTVNTAWMRDTTSSDVSRDVHAQRCAAFEIVQREMRRLSRTRRGK